ncbi:hypothetical protein ACVWW1_008477 [Bradyrhizobium sp. JR3.5]
MAGFSLSHGERALPSPCCRTSHAVTRVDDRRALTGVLYVLPTRNRGENSPERYGLYTTVDNRFNRQPRRRLAADFSDSGNPLSISNARPWRCPQRVGSLLGTALADGFKAGLNTAGTHGELDVQRSLSNWSGKSFRTRLATSCNQLSPCRNGDAVAHSPDATQFNSRRGCNAVGSPRRLPGQPPLPHQGSRANAARSSVLRRRSISVLAARSAARADPKWAPSMRAKSRSDEKKRKPRSSRTTIPAVRSDTSMT